MLSLEQRVVHAEDRLNYLEAIVDGGEAQLHDSTAFVISLVTRHLHEIGVLDIGKLRSHLEEFGAKPSDAEDYMGQAVRGLVAMIDYQHR